MSTGRLRPTEPDAKALGDGLSDLRGARVHIDVTIPRTKIAGRMRLVDRDEALAIKSETRKLFARDGLLDTEGRVVGVASDDWNAEIGVRHLAIAVRDPGDVEKPIASLAEWRECDDDQIAGLWNRYQDLREQIDPLGEAEESLRLSVEDLDVIREAVKKKAASVLMSFGSRKLAIYMLTSAGLPEP